MIAAEGGESVWECSKWVDYTQMDDQVPCTYKT